MAEAITKMSNGRINVKLYGAGELVPAFEVLDAVSRGTAEMGHSGAYYWKGKHEATQFFSSVPFGLNAMEMNSWLYYGGGLELWRELYAPFGVVPFPGGNSGVQMGGWFNKEINSVNDLNGLKMRIPGLGGEVLAKLGGVPVNIPGGEVFTSLQAGAIDAAEWVGPYNDLAFGLFKAAKYYYYPGWQEPGATLECVVNTASTPPSSACSSTAPAISARAATRTSMLGSMRTPMRRRPLFTIHCTAPTMGARMRTIHFTGPATARAISSAAVMAKVLGPTSPKMSRSGVSTMVVMSGAKIAVEAGRKCWRLMAEAATCTRLAPSSTAPIMRSRFSLSLLTFLAARRSPSRSKRGHARAARRR